MRRIIKRTLCALLSLALVCAGLTALPVAAQAAQAGQVQAAQALYDLGLFQGTGTLPDGSPDFDLDGSVTRGQAVTMVVRLLGAEREAQAVHYCHPFGDANWAGDYVGYAYYAGITDGVSDTAFGTRRQIGAAQFVTLILRALGYSQVDWRDPWPTAKAVGLAWSGTEDFRRGDMAAICYSALSCTVNGTGRTLRQQLAQQGAFDSGSEQPYDFVPGPVTARIDRLQPSSGAELRELLGAAVGGRAEKFTVQVPAAQIGDYVRLIQGNVEWVLDSHGTYMEYYPYLGTIEVTPAYTDAARVMAYLEGKRGSLSAQDMEVLNEAKHVHFSLVDSTMSEYAQVKAFHDYLVDNTAYRDTGSLSKDAAGPLLEGYGVCDGYAVAFDLLCYLSGIDCVRVTGTAGGGEHAWNKVKIGGNWYNVDVTWDDPVSNRPILRYDYFLVSDSVLAKDHQWTASSFWPAAPANWTGR